MRILVILLCLAGTAMAQQRKKQDPPATDRSILGKKEPQAVDVTVRSGTELSFDDNILELNDKQIRQLDSGTRPEKFRIDQAEDFVYTVWAELRLKGKWIGDTTHAGLKVQPYLYQSNSIANYEEYEIFVRQNIGKHDAGIAYQIDHDVYLRELEIVVPGPNLWESARYTEHDLEFHYRHQVTAMLSIRPMAGYRAKDFASPFQFRDIEGFFAGIGATLEIGKDIQVFAKYEYSDLDAEADALDPDTSHSQHEIEVGGGIELFKMLDLSLRYRLALRDYTTSNDPLDDPSHADREDVRHKLTFRAKVKISKSWSVHLEYVFRQVDSDRPHDDDAATSEPGNSTRNVVSIGATLTF